MGRALIVSAGASSNEYIAARLAEMGYARPVILPSGAEARRRMPDADFDLIVVNAPPARRVRARAVHGCRGQHRRGRGVSGQGRTGRTAAGPP